MELNQSRPALFYFLAVDARIKFGITTDWERRYKQYQRDIGEFATQPFKTENYDHRCQAELVEQVLKWRLWDFITHDEHEWVEHLPIDTILHVYRETRDQLRPEFEKHRHIHTRGEDRWGYYKQIADYQFKTARGRSVFAGMDGFLPLPFPKRARHGEGAQVLHQPLRW